MAPWLRYLLAFVVFCHGFIYVRIGSVLPREIKQWDGRSKLLGRTVANTGMMPVIRAVHVLAGLAWFGCAAAIAFAPVPWRPWALAAGAIGVAAFALFWDGRVQYFAEEGGIGAGVSLAAFACALAF